MSYAEQKWTVDQVNRSITNGTIGKDLHIAGVPRGCLIRSVSRSTNISGKGWFIGASAHAGTSSGAATCTVGVTIDNDKRYTVSAYSHTYSASYDVPSNAALSFSDAAIGSGFDEGSKNVVVHSNTDENKTVVGNKPIRFDDSCSIVISNETQKCWGSVSYILDPSYQGGGITPKIQSKNFPGWDFRENVSEISEGRCAA